MQFNAKPLLLCGFLLAAVFTLASCGAKTEFEKVEVETTTAVSAIQPAAVDAVPVLTEPSSADAPAETTTRRRTNSRRNNTPDAPAETPDDSESPANAESPNVPEAPETPAEPEVPETPDEPETPTAPTEGSSEPAETPTEPTAPDTGDAE